MTSSEEPAGIEAPFTMYVSVPLKPSKKTSPVIPDDDVLDKYKLSHNINELYESDQKQQMNDSQQFIDNQITKSNNSKPKKILINFL